MHKLSWVILYGFRSKFHTLFSGANILKIDEDLTKLQGV